MPNILPIPSELQLLLEKREAETRRTEERREQTIDVENDERKGTDRRQRRRRSQDRSR